MTGWGGHLRVLIVDDHAVFAESLAAALAEQDGFEVVGIAGTGGDALDRARASLPEVVLLDYRLPDADGASLIAALADAAPDCRVVVLTAAGDDRTVASALDAGCSGYLTKDQRLEEVVAALRAVAAGEAVVAPGLLGRALPLMRRSVRARAVTLTGRERDVLELMALGLANAAIAGQLGLSVNTVRNHVQNVLSKLGAHSKLEAVVIAGREGLLPPGGDGRA